MRPFLRPVLWFGLLHFLVTLSLGGIIFLVSHIPPKAVSLDGLILFLHAGESILTGPRQLMLWACPGESTPGWLGPVSTILNSLLWGMALAGARRVWRAMLRSGS